MKAHYIVEIRDREGKLLKRLRRKSRSYVQAWNKLVCVHAGSANQTIKDTGGTDRTITYTQYSFGVAAIAGNDAGGIVYGTGIGAVAIADYALGTQIAEGTGSGQLEYQAVTVSSPTVSAPDCSFTVTRSAINNSGATITVKEIGIYVNSRDSGATVRFLCAIRDVLAASQAVPDGGSITVVYTIKVTV